MILKTALRVSAALLVASTAAPSLAQQTSPGEWDRLIKERDQKTRKFFLNHDEWRQYQKIRRALDAKDYSKAGAAITWAENTVEGGDAADAIASLKLELGLETGDVPLQNRAVEEVLASGVASKNNRLKLQRRQGLGEIWEADYDAAETVLRDYLERTPDKVDAIILLAETKYRANRHREALALLEQAIALDTAAKRPIPARWLAARASLMSSAPYEAERSLREK